MKYILVADDEFINQEIIREILDEDYEVVCVDDGVACMESISQRIPDLLLLDYSMPHMNGVEVLEKLRADEKTKDIPVALLSGFATDEHIQAGMDAGANLYVTKPFTPQKLRDTVTQFLG